MTRSITSWTLATAAAVLLAVPAPGVAQTTGTATPQTQPPTSSAATQQAPEAAREHLSKAKAALNQIDAATLDARARTQLTELNKRMIALERTVGADDSASATGQAIANRGSVNWGTEVAAIDKALTTLLAPASTTGAIGTTTPPATGTSGTSGAPGMTVDETTRAKLNEVRTHITAFATVMAGGKAETSSEPANSTASSPMTSGSSATATTPQQPPTQPPAQTPPATAAQVNQTAARQHLTEARNTLSAMTQLPAATQLQGEARAQVSQLITNFNELITTQIEWRATYAKLEANLTALLGPDPAASAAAVTGTAGTTGSTGSTGATAGTSGSGTVELDPAIREKLAELRRNLNAFEKAAGGVATGEASAASGSPSSTGSTASSATTGTAGTTGSPATEQSAMQTAQAGNADVMKHVAAMDALLKMQDDSGGLTLTKAQVEQLRTHWAAVRAAIEKR